MSIPSPRKGIVAAVTFGSIYLLGNGVAKWAAYPSTSFVAAKKQHNGLCTVISIKVVLSVSYMVDKRILIPLLNQRRKSYGHFYSV